MAVELLHDPDRVRLALTPIRRTLLDRLQEPASATQIATELNLPRQRINYPLRALERAGLVELVEHRQRRGCTERIVVAAAEAFVVDPALLGDTPEASQDRFAASHLMHTAADVVRDVARQQAEAETAGTRLLTFTLETEIGFATPHDLERHPNQDRETVHIPLTGDPWFETENQVGVINDGRLIIRTPERVIMSRYGDD